MKKREVIIDKQFILNRVFELITAPILIGFAFAILGPLILVGINILVPLNEEQRYTLIFRSYAIVTLGFIAYSWHKAFTTSPPNEDMDIIYGHAQYHHRKKKE